MNTTAEQIKDAPLPLEPFEFECDQGKFQLLNDSVKMEVGGSWFRIDVGNPERIGKGVKAALFIFLMALFHLVDWTPPRADEQPRQDVARTLQMRGAKTEGLAI